VNKEIIDLTDVKGLSERLGVPTATVYYWVSRNEVPYIKVGRHLRFNLVNVIKYFEHRTGASRLPCFDRPSKLDSRLSRSLKSEKVRAGLDSSEGSSNYGHNEKKD
jgi:excisionase family DNA binding protein